MSTSGKGLQVTYPTISLHAISRADFGPSIYCQLDESIDVEEEPTPDEEDAMEMRELRINTRSEESRMFPLTSLISTPPNTLLVEPIFEALSQCAALHPDEGEGDDEFDDAFLDADEVGFEAINADGTEELSEAGRVRSDFSGNARYAPY
jgi:nucleotide-sensitive chloride channel 1A